MVEGSYISITLNENGLKVQQKDPDWLNGYKNKSPIYAFYNRPTSNLETYMYRLKVRG